MSCQQRPRLAGTDSFGSNLRWQVDLQHQRHRFPVGHGQYNVGLKLLVVKGLTGTPKVLHLCTDLPGIPPTYRDENRALIHALRSFVLPVDQMDHFTVDCSATMEYHQIDMNSQIHLNVTLFDDLGQRQDNVTGHALFYIQKI